MTPEIIIHAENFANEREFIQTAIENNIEGKLNSYIKKHNPHDAKVRVEVTLERKDKEDNHKDPEFTGKVVITIESTTFRSERENFKKLDDLIAHMFTHIKEQMAR